jgi:hypothetical protein
MFPVFKSKSRKSRLQIRGGGGDVLHLYLTTISTIPPTLRCVVIRTVLISDALVAKSIADEVAILDMALPIIHLFHITPWHIKQHTARDGKINTRAILYCQCVQSLLHTYTHPPTKNIILEEE